MRNEDKIRLKHMLDAARLARDFAVGKNRKDLDKDIELVLAIIKAIEIIGEAANKVTDECQNEYPQIPWMEIIGMRNRLIHAYFDIDLDIVWQTVTKEIPEVIVELEKALNKVN